MKCIICNSCNHSIFATGILDGAEAKMILQSKGLDIIKCDKCGLFSFSPQPTSRQLKKYHSKEYFIATSPERQIGYANYIEPEHRLAKIDWGKKLIKYLSNLDKRWFKRKNKLVLDVGCATGFTTFGMSEYCKAVGVDISEWAIEYGKNEFPELPLFCGNIYDNLDLPKPFDYIIFWDSLEHDAKPVKAIKQASKLLKRHGLIMIQTPDGAASKENWYYWSPHQHSYIFNAENLTSLLRKHKLKIIENKLGVEKDELIIVARKK